MGDHSQCAELLVPDAWSELEHCLSAGALAVILTHDAGTGDYGAFNRVSSGYHLNEMMWRNPLTRSIKAAANATLGLMGLGDTIRILAEK